MAFRLIANPTFWATVLIPAPGTAAQPLELEFRHRTRSQLKAFGESLSGRTDDQIVPEMIVSWRGADAEFSPEALVELLEQYPAAAGEIAAAYFREHTAAARKN